MKDLWDLAVTESKRVDNDSKRSHQLSERTLIICGSKGVGKSTLINSLLQKDDQIKPTIALEYSFGYVVKGSDKETGHVYELGGGVWLAKMLSSVLNSAVISHASMAVMVDLTSPSTIWRVLDQLLNTAKAACDSAIEQLDKQSRAQMLEEAANRFPDDHIDKAVQGLLRPFPIPLVIIGSKYDLYQAMEPEPRKQVARGLRFFAHTFGATLLFYSHRQEQLLSRTNAVLSNLVFGTEMPVRNPQLEHNKALYVPIGADNFGQIGVPPATENRIRATDPVQLWRESLTAIFPLSEKDEELMFSGPSLVSNNPVTDPQFAEAAIDQLRKQKDVELERYRRQSERRARDLIQAGGEMQDIYD